MVSVSITSLVSLLFFCEEPSFIAVADSWREQRQFVYQAVEALYDHPAVSRINDELSRLVAELPDLRGKLLMCCAIFVTR